MYSGDDLTAILPRHLKKCRQKSMLNQLPKCVKDKHNLKNWLKKASKVVRKNMRASELGLGSDEEEKQSDHEYLPAT